MAYSRWSTIGTDQPNAKQEKVLPGQYFGFTVGTKSTGSMEAALNAWDTFTGDYTEAVAWGLPNSMGTPNLTPLAGITRFVVFAAPLIPHNVSGSSITTLLAGGYDAQIDANAAAVVSLGLGKKQACRWGWEYNSGAGDSPTQGFEWASGRRDPVSGNINGMARVHLAQAYVENRWRAQGYTGYAAWSGGTGDTSAATIDNAIPTHGDPSLVVWDWDIYPNPPWNGTKNAMSVFTAKADLQYNAYLAYCKANGILMGHSEVGQIYAPKSDQRYNDIGGFWEWLYAKGAANAGTVAWMIAYFQSTPYVAPGGTPVLLDESHSIAFSVPTSGGSPMGTAATTPWTGDYPPGVSVPNVNGANNTIANTGSLQHSSDLGLHWVWTPDPSKHNAMMGWRRTFGGEGGALGLGAAGLRVPPQPDVPGQTTSAQLAASTNHRGQLAVFA